MTVYVCVCVLDEPELKKQLSRSMGAMPENYTDWYAGFMDKDQSITHLCIEPVIVFRLKNISIFYFTTTNKFNLLKAKTSHFQFLASLGMLESGACVSE